MGRFEGRTAVVTGAGGGIGARRAQLLAAQGARAALPAKPSPSAAASK
jgi:NAD(P)-dependent dehydrogenase (short-subunit alcohol dehydrogenase family)